MGGCVWVPAGGREGSGFPPAMPAGAPSLSWVERVKTTPFMREKGRSARVNMSMFSRIMFPCSRYCWFLTPGDSEHIQVRKCEFKPAKAITSVPKMKQSPCSSHLRSCLSAHSDNSSSPPTSYCTSCSLQAFKQMQVHMASCNSQPSETC